LACRLSQNFETLRRLSINTWLAEISRSKRGTRFLHRQQHTAIRKFGGFGGLAVQLLAIDPGKSMGWACFLHGRLIGSGQGAPNDIMRFIQSADAIVFEEPEIYRPRHCKGNPNDLKGMLIQIGYIQGKSKNGCKWHRYLPVQWKGQLPKRITKQRAEACLSSQDCIGPKQNELDAWDAVALGLWFLKRLRLG
jgi:hypothetical protein